VDLNSIPDFASLSNGWRHDGQCVQTLTCWHDAETVPLVGLTPTMPLNAAGMRPLPAVSVPRVNETIPAKMWDEE
jgi:hypothetical protein